MKDKIRRVGSMAFLLAALVLFITYHLTPGFGHEQGGWRIWVRLWEHVRDLVSLRSQDTVVLAAFLNFSVLIVASPFLKNVWPKSLWAWWGAVIFSGLAAAAFWIMFLVTAPEDSLGELGIGGWSLMIAPVLNFIGLLMARGDTTEIPDA